MTGWSEDEWIQARSMMAANWMFDSGYNEQAYRRELSQFPQPDVLKALEALSREVSGRGWVPKCSQIKARLRVPAPAVVVGPRVEGDRALERVGRGPWWITAKPDRHRGGWFHPEPDTLLVQPRQAGDVVSGAGRWDTPDGMLVWESFDLSFVNANTEARAA